MQSTLMPPPRSAGPARRSTPPREQDSGSLIPARRRRESTRSPGLRSQWHLWNRFQSHPLGQESDSSRIAKRPRLLGQDDTADAPRTTISTNRMEEDEGFRERTENDEGLRDAAGPSDTDLPRPSPVMDERPANTDPSTRSGQRSVSGIDSSQSDGPASQPRRSPENEVAKEILYVVSANAQISARKIAVDVAWLYGDPNANRSLFDFRPAPGKKNGVAYVSIYPEKLPAEDAVVVKEETESATEMQSSVNGGRLPEPAGKQTRAFADRKGKGKMREQPRRPLDE
ncbi:hypothetical protein PLICRDRAFT_183992 [Plicaturopsis crispa FD-325 SS-3]|nr:hypothetical protein PLICRDRAFT_183992 [Plicaturopsis crispa FD-325 SS-3]